MPLTVRLCLVAASSLLILLFSTLCLGNQYQKCLLDKYLCEGVEFSYPFGRKGSGCGDPQFHLYSCDLSGRPLLNINGNEYQILKYSFLGNDSDHKMTIVNDNLFWDRCNPSQNYSQFWWLGSHFHISTDTYANLTLWGHCNEKMRRAINLQLCDDDWYYNIRSPEDRPRSCKTQLQLPIRKEYLQNFRDFIIKSSLLQGFEITWQVDTNRSLLCEDCFKSQGMCGYNISDSTTFLCYCSDGTSHPDKCPALPGRKNKFAIVIGCSVGGIALTAKALVLLTYCAKRSKASRSLGSVRDSSKYERKDMEECVPRLKIANLSIFSYEELRQATNCFHEDNELGDGGFGSVYLGKLSDGRTVAVKRLYQDNSRRLEQFLNEVQIFSTLSHPHIVRLYGCTSADSPQLLLVYEFVPNGTLENHLHGNRKGPRGLPWNTRLNIAIQTAQALTFLHSFNPPIFHRDVKSSNILLDENFKVKLADFGLCRYVPLNASHVTTAPQGTPGYVDPEYHQYYQLTEKSDVYSFGVVLVEIISAKLAVDTNRNRSEINLANMAISKIQERALHELVDPQLEMEMNDEVKVAVSAVAELAFRCLASESDDRPQMKEIVAQLEEIRGLQFAGRLSICIST